MVSDRLHEPPGSSTGVSPVGRSQDSHGRDARAIISPHWFMGPVHSINLVEALHEPGSAGIPAGELPTGVSPARRRRSRSRHWFIGPLHRINIVGALHEPEDACLDFEGLTNFRFKVPMRAQKRKGAFHEPPHAPPGFGRCRTVHRFRVPMHAKKRNRNSG
jgi:hypothetical protein